MKKLWYLGISLVLALTMLAPATALAKEPPVQHATSVTYATGNVKDITDADVKWVSLDPSNPYNPLAGYWDVKKRNVNITLSGRDIKGSFVLTYKGTFLADQSGSLSGVMQGDHKAFTVTATTQSATFLTMYPLPTGESVPLYQLPIAGNWKGTEGTRATGTFFGTVVFIPIKAADGLYHIYKVIPSLSPIEMDITSHGNGGGD